RAAAGEPAVGDRIIAAMILPCGACERCRRGLGSHCPQRLVPGVERGDGCFSERFTLPVSALVRVPDAVDDDRAVFVHDVAAALQAARQLDAQGGGYITVLGDGPL